VLEAVLAAAFPEDDEASRAAWALAKASVLEAVTEIVFEQLARSGVDAARVKVVTEVLAAVVDSLEQKGRFSLEDLAEQLQAALAA
jgi:hypothetical protein